MKRVLFTVSACAVLLLSALSADAQNGTGPIKKSNGGTISKSIPAPNQGLTPARVTELLQAKGAQVTSSNPEVNGTKFTVLRTKMQADDFGYQFDVVFVTYPNGNQVWYLFAPLNTNGAGLTPEKLQGLLKHNFVMGGAQTFMIDPQSGSLTIETSRFSMNWSDQNFQNELNIYLKNIKDTYRLWGAGE